MIKSNFTLFETITLPELADKIRRPESTLRIILDRAEFSKFRQGKKYILSPSFCYKLYKFFDLRKEKCHNVRSLERTQILLLKLATTL